MKNTEDNIKDNTVPDGEEPTRDKAPRAPAKRTQGQMIQEALGLEPHVIQEIEKKLFIARFLDFYSEETLDFAYKDRSVDQYQDEMHKFLSSADQMSEEDKLLKKSFESNKVFDIIQNLKKKAEETARANGINEPIDNRLRKISLIVTLPMFGVLIFLMFLPPEWMMISFPLLCVFCMLPQFLRASIIKKWYAFKESNKHQFYSENREDIMVLKGYTGDLLNSIRSRLLDLKVPLQLIKFVLHSRDYDNLNLINQKVIRGTPQYFFSFEYPPGMDPFPIPELLKSSYQDPMFTERRDEPPEQNFIVLTDLKAKDGVIKQFVPSLKSQLADPINSMLNDCEFEKSNVDFSKIIPKYSADLGIYCVCGDLAEIINVQYCNWKKKFKFYLFEGGECKCGDKIYALSRKDDDDDIPDELKNLFS